MGTRTHGDDDTEIKKVQKIQKAKESTTGLLGVRLHGMQVGLESLFFTRGLFHYNEQYKHHFRLLRCVVPSFQ